MVKSPTVTSTPHTGHRTTLIPNWLVVQGQWPQEARLERAERNVLEVLYLHAFDKGVAFVSYRTIAREAGVSESYVKQHTVSHLRELGLVQVRSDGTPAYGEQGVQAAPIAITDL